MYQKCKSGRYSKELKKSKKLCDSSFENKATNPVIFAGFERIRAVIKTHEI